MAETIRHKRNRLEKESLYEIGYKYLHDNFHKFSQRNKIKVALAIVQIEKAKPLIDQSTHTHFTVILESDKRSESSADAETESRFSVAD